MTSPAEFYESLPPISKAWGTILVALAVLTQLNVLNPAYIILSFPLAFGKLQIWRLLTCFLWLPFSMFLLLVLLSIFQFSVKLEKDVYEGRPADYLFMLIFGMVAMLPCTLIPVFASPILTYSLANMVVYVWSRNYPNNDVSIMGVVSVPGFYLPWAYAFIDMILGRGVFPSLLGFLVGHLYYFLTSIYPATSGHTLLTTPSWVYWIIAKWAEQAPGMFPPGAGVPQNTQRVYLRAPSARPSSSAAGAGGASGSQARATGAASQPSSGAFRGRGYRLDRD